MAISETSTTITITTSKDSGTATSGTSTTLTDTGQSWTASAYVDRICWIRSGTGIRCLGRITANTATVLTVKMVRFDGDDDVETVTPDNTSVYEISINVQDLVDAGMTVTKTGVQQFRQTRTISLTGNTCFHDSDIQWELSVGSKDQLFKIATTALLSFGYIDENNSTKGGVSVRAKSTKSSSSIIQLFTGSGTTGIVKWYSSRFTFESTSATRGWFGYLNTSSGYHDFKDCSFDGFRGGIRVQGTETRIDGLTFTDQIGTAGPLNFVGAIGFANDIRVQNSSYAFYWFQGFAGPTVRGLSSEDVGDTILMWGGTGSGNLKLIDYSGDALTIAQTNSPNSTQQIEEIYTYAPTVLDASSNDLEDVRLFVSDLTDTEVVNKLSSSAGVYTENLLLRGKYKASTGNTLNAETPHTVKFRLYDYQAQEISYTADTPFKSAVVMLANTFTDASESTAAAYTGITVSGPSSTVTISTSHTAQEIYDYLQWWSTESANIKYDVPMVTFDGVNYQLATGWKLVLSTAITNGINVTGNVDFTAVINVTAHNITGDLTFTVAGTYNITNSTVDEVINTSGGAVTIKAYNSTLTTNTGPNITINYPVDVTIHVVDAASGADIQNARVFIETDPGSVELYNDLTDADGEISFSHNYLSDQDIVGNIRRGTSTPLYKASSLSGTIISSGFTSTVPLVSDE